MSNIWVTSEFGGNSVMGGKKVRPQESNNGVKKASGENSFKSLAVKAKRQEPEGKARSRGGFILFSWF